MKVLLLLLQLNSFNYAYSFIVQKLTASHPLPTNIKDFGQQFSNYAASDVKFTILANNNYNLGEEVPSVAHLIKSLRVPGFNVYRIVFNRDTKINANVQPFISNEHISNIGTEKSKDSVSFHLADTKVFENDDKHKYEFNCEGKNSTDEGTCNEETTTHTNDVTTDIDLSNDNSTMTSEYDDESYGSLSDRSDIPPGLLASLVG